MYIIIDEFTIFRTVDNTSIPKDLENSDYQAYLLWLEAGNQPIDRSSTK